MLFKQTPEKRLKAEKKELLRGSFGVTAVTGACRAVMNGWSDVLEKIASREGFSVDDAHKVMADIVAARHLGCATVFQRAYNGIEYRKVFLEQVVQAGWTEARDMLLNIGSYVRDGDFLTLFSDNADTECLKAFLDRESGYGPHYYLKAAARRPVLLGKIIEALEGRTLPPNNWAEVAQNLCACNNRSPEVDAAFAALLALGMNVDYENGAVMTAALKNGHIALAEEMIRSGFSIGLMRSCVYPALQGQASSAEGIVFARQALGKISTRAAVENFECLDDTSVAMVQSLPSGGELTTIFNFALSQQILIAKSGDSMGAPSVVPFSQIENHILLGRAADAFVAGGGDAELADFARRSSAGGIGGITAARTPVRKAGDK